MGHDNVVALPMAQDHSRKCENCGAKLAKHDYPGKRFCSAKCKQAAYRRRKKEAA